MPTPADLRHAKLVIERGFAVEAQVARLLNEMKGAPPGQDLLELLVARGLITAGQAQTLRDLGTGDDRSDEDAALGKRVVDQKLVSAAQVRECFAIIQDLKKKGAANPPRLGQLLLTKGYVTEEEISQLVQSGEAPVEPSLELLDNPSAATGQGNRGPSIIPDPDELLIPEAPPPRKVPAVAPPPRPAAAAPARPPVSARRGAVALANTVKCTFCGLEIREGTPRSNCEHCGDLYHQECWGRSSGCVRDACQDLNAVKTGQKRVLASTEYSLYTELKPLLMKIVGGAGLLAVLVMGYFHFAHDAQYYYELGKSVGHKSSGSSGSGDRAWRAADLHRATLAIEDTTGTMGGIEKTVALEEQSRYFRFATEKKPDFVEAWFALGTTYFELKKYREALAALQRVLELSPGHMDALLFLGNSAENLGDLAEAERWFRKAIEVKPDQLDAHELLAYLFSRKCTGRQKDAAAEFDLILKARPGDAVIAAELAQILIAGKQYAEALAVLDRVSAQTPDAPAIDQRRAELYFAQQNWEQALRYAEPQAAAEKDTVAMRRIQAISLWKLGRDREAFVVGKVVCGFGPDPEVYAMTGLLAIRFGEPELGVSNLRIAFQETHKPETLERIGETQLLMARADEARATFEELRSLDSAWPRVIFKIGLAAAATSDRTQALAAIKDLRSRVATDPDLRAIELRLQREAGDAPGALAGLKTLVTENPTSFYARFQLAISLRSGGNPAAALNEFRNAFAIVPDPEVRYEMGLTYAALKKEGPAREAMQQYVDAVPFGAHYQKAVATISTGGTQEADPFSTVVASCADLVPKLSTQILANPYHWMHVSAALHGTEAAAAVLGRVPDKAMYAVQQLGVAYAALQTSPQYTSPEMIDVVLNSSVERWLASYKNAIESLTACVQRRDTDKRRTEALDGVLEELRQKIELNGTTAERAAASSRALTSILGILIGILSDTDTTREQLERISTQRRVQTQFCANQMEQMCGEVYSAVKSADLLISIQDRRKLYEDRQRAILRRFDQRELTARTVAEQLRNGMATLAELLGILAADPSLRP